MDLQSVAILGHKVMIILQLKSKAVVKWCSLILVFLNRKKSP